jgi:small-conductance mechanosensitive channel
VNEIRQQLTQAFTELGNSIVAWAPRLVVAIVLIVLAIIVAKIIEQVLKAILRRLNLESLISRMGTDQTLRRMGLKHPLSVIVPKIVYYLLLILFANAAADGLGLTAISSAISTFMGYLPHVFAAAVILLLGAEAAQFAGRWVTRAATSSGIEFAGSLGGMVSAVVLAVVGIMAIGQLQVETDIVRIVVMAVLGAMVLAFGLSFGLGSREVTRNIIAGFYARKTFRIGEEMEIAGETGVLTAITPTQTILDQDGRTVAVANSTFLEEVVKQG